MTTKTVCKNSTCDCEAVPGKQYCSGYCSNVDQSEAVPGYADIEGQCACGHQGCHAGHAAFKPTPPLSVGND